MVSSTRSVRAASRVSVLTSTSTSRCTPALRSSARQPWCPKKRIPSSRRTSWPADASSGRPGSPAGCEACGVGLTRPIVDTGDAWPPGPQLVPPLWEEEVVDGAEGVESQSDEEKSQGARPEEGQQHESGHDKGVAGVGDAEGDVEAGRNQIAVAVSAEGAVNAPAPLDRVHRGGQAERGSSTGFSRVSWWSIGLIITTWKRSSKSHWNSCMSCWRSLGPGLRVPASRAGRKFWVTPRRRASS